MTSNELQFDALNQRNLQVLQAYADRHFAAKAADDDYAGWLDRVESAGELNADQLTRVHGELIALGMLRFELTNRQTGLRYQISDRGHQALLTPTGSEVDADDPGSIFRTVDPAENEFFDESASAPSEAA